MDYGSISVCAKRIHFPSFFKIVAAAAAAAPGFMWNKKVVPKSMLSWF